MREEGDICRERDAKRERRNNCRKRGMLRRREGKTEGREGC